MPVPYAFSTRLEEQPAGQRPPREPAPQPREGDLLLVAAAPSAEAFTAFLRIIEKEPWFSEVLLSKQVVRGNECAAACSSEPCGCDSSHERQCLTAELRYSARHPLARAGVRVLLGAVRAGRRAGAVVAGAARRRCVAGPDRRQAARAGRGAAGRRAAAPVRERAEIGAGAGEEARRSRYRRCSWSMGSRGWRAQHGVRMASETYEEGRSAGGQALLLAESSRCRAATGRCATSWR
ncbi:MAG: hypothetical protein M0C28_17790 [Candidatus Moduliflexus flocculans]|nr:hypothetical protein [Candidatus Moduliflexus flocculans]